MNFDKSGKLILGEVYWVAGQGPMRITELPDPPRKTTITLKTLFGYTYYAAPEHLVSFFEKDQVLKHLATLREKIGVSADDEESAAEFIAEMKT